jgi:DNA-binding protein HU-beta
MNKAELISRVAASLDITKAAATVVIETTLATIADEVLSVGAPVALKGFGTFAPKTRAEHLGRNPRTGEAVLIPTRTLMGFKPSKPAKAA